MTLVLIRQLHKTLCQLREAPLKSADRCHLPRPIFQWRGWLSSESYKDNVDHEYTQGVTRFKRNYLKLDQVHLARRTHFVDLVIHDICSQKIIPYFADLVIHNICSQKIMPYFFDKLSTSIRNFAQWASTFCFSFLNCFCFWVKFLFGKKFLGENFFG